MQRPAYLTNAPDLSERAVQGMGTVLPPHVSIRGNKFTLVDGAGNKKVLGDTMDFLVADINEHGGKMYYANPQWTPDSDDPPTCWSSNGVGPSRDAMTPQARTCAECKWNERGSRISAMGSSVKACRDEVLTAIVHPQFPGMLFKLTITPGSFKNWRKHVEEAKNVSPGDHVGTVLTRATFDPEQSGVVVFKAVSYPDQPTWEARTKALTSKSTDILVGRNDRPRELPAPAAQQALPAAALMQQDPHSTGFNQQQGQPVAIAAQSQAEPEHQKRKRRTKAEIEADNAAARQAQQGSAFGQPGSPAQAAIAPFRPDAPPAPNGQGAPFGVGNAPSPSAEMQASLDAAFGKAPAGGGFGS